MEEVAARLPAVVRNLDSEISELMWTEIKNDLEKLNWLEPGNTSQILRNYLELVDSYGVFLLGNPGKLSVLNVVQVTYFINTQVFKEKNKQCVKEMITLATEFTKTLNYFKLARDILHKQPIGIQATLETIIINFKDILQKLMIAFMPLSFKLKKVLKKDIQTYIRDLFNHEVLLTIKYHYSRNQPIVNLISEFEPPNRGSYYSQTVCNFYYGDLNDNVREGFGRLFLENGDKFEGYFKSDRLNGPGVYIWKNKDWYKGEFADGEITGNGVKTFSNGAKYEGSFVKGKMHGLGKMTFKNGDTYEGMWAQDTMNGQGEYSWKKSGERFKGNMRFDFKESGVIVDKDGTETNI